jgi:hypothetical protein
LVTEQHPATLACFSEFEKAPRERWDRTRSCDAGGIRAIARYDAVSGVREFQKLNEAIERADLIVPIGAEYPLGEAAKAHECLAAGTCSERSSCKCSWTDRAAEITNDTALDSRLATGFTDGLPAPPMTVYPCSPRTKCNVSVIPARSQANSCRAASAFSRPGHFRLFIGLRRNGHGVLVRRKRIFADATIKRRRQNFALRIQPIGVRVPIGSTVGDPQMVGAFANGFFQILHELLL